MTMVRYHVQACTNGPFVISATPFAIGKEVEVVLRIPQEENNEQTEQRKTVGQRFFDTWNGMLDAGHDNEGNQSRMFRKAIQTMILSISLDTNVILNFALKHEQYYVPVRAMSISKGQNFSFFSRVLPQNFLKFLM